MKRWLSENEAWEAINTYEEENYDLDPEVRRAMALAIVGPRIPKARLEKMFGPGLGWVRRDYSWRWWNILQLAGLGQHWERFRDTATSDGKTVRDAYDELWPELTDHQREVLLRRSFYYPAHDHRESGTTEVWTKASVWQRDDGFARILVLGESLAPRPKRVWWHNAQDERLVEQELRNLIDPDTTRRPDCMWQAVSYVGSRYNAGYTQKIRKEKVAAWFFEEVVPHMGQRKFFTPEGRRLQWKPWMLGNWT